MCIFLTGMSAEEDTYQKVRGLLNLRSMMKKLLCSWALNRINLKDKFREKTSEKISKKYFTYVWKNNTYNREKNIHIYI